MVNISKKPLEDSILFLILDELAHSIQKTKRTSDARRLIHELLTHSEKIQLAKRLAVITCIDREVPFTVICNTLNVSPTTVAHLTEQYRQGKFSSISSSGTQSTKANRLILAVGKILNFGLPLLAGKGRLTAWKSR